jgi:hypothetical protein
LKALTELPVWVMISDELSDHLALNSIGGVVMDWWLIILALIAAALTYGYWEHTSQSRYLTRFFALLAERHQGEVKRASPLVLPQLRFETNGRRFLVTAMATSGTVAAGASGYSGPFTFVDLQLPFDTARETQIVRASGAGDQLLDLVLPGAQVSTGDADFDAAFRISGRDKTFAPLLLDETVRQKLLNSHLPRLDIRVAGQKIAVHMDGIAQSLAELEELIEISALLADRASAGAGSTER